MDPFDQPTLGFEGFAPSNLNSSIEKVAKDYGVHPDAIKQVIQVESGGDPRASTGSYNGLTQIGRTTFNEAGGRLGGLTYDQFLQATPEQQVAAYGDYLKHYDFKGQMAKHGIDVSSLPADQQFAILQGMQFSPNGQGWKAAFARGDLSVPVTNTKQASSLGDTSISAMAGSSFGRRLMGVPLPPATSVASLPPPAAPISGPPPLSSGRPLPPQVPNLALLSRLLQGRQQQQEQQAQAQQEAPQQHAMQMAPMLNAPIMNMPELEPLKRQMILAKTFQGIPLPPGFRGVKYG